MRSVVLFLIVNPHRPLILNRLTSKNVVDVRLNKGRRMSVLIVRDFAAPQLETKQMPALCYVSLRE